MDNSNALAPFDKLAADIKVHIAPVMDLKVTDENSKNDVLTAGRGVKDYQNRIEEKRKELKAPHLEACKLIDNYAKKIREPIDQAEAHLKGQLLAFERELEKVRQAELKKAEDERRRKEKEAADRAKAAKDEAEMAAMFAEPGETTQVEATAQVVQEREQAEIDLSHRNNVRSIESMKVSGAGKHWTFRIEDEAKIPREFLMVDERKIRQAVREGTREIAGVTIFQETRVSLR